MFLHLTNNWSAFCYHQGNLTYFFCLRRHIYICIIISAMLYYFQCSESCDQGVMKRNLSCLDKLAGNQVVREEYCTRQGLSKPRDTRNCNKKPCPFRWLGGDWSEVLNSAKSMFFSDTLIQECLHFSRCLLVQENVSVYLLLSVQLCYCNSRYSSCHLYVLSPQVLEIDVTNYPSALLSYYRVNCEATYICTSY